VTKQLTVTVSALTTVSALNPSSAPTGTLVTITGKGFTPSGNTVYFGSLTLGANYLSTSGGSITFTVPPSAIAGGGYSVGVANANGASNTVAFTTTAKAAGVAASSPHRYSAGPAVR